MQKIKQANKKMRTTTSQKMFSHKTQKLPSSIKKTAPPNKNPFSSPKAGAVQSTFSPLRYSVNSTISQTPFKKVYPQKIPLVFKYHFMPMSPQKVTYQEPMRETLEYTPGVTEDRSFSRFNYSFKETKDLNAKLRRICSEEEFDNYKSVQIKPTEFHVTHQIFADDAELMVGDGKDGNKKNKETVIEKKKEITVTKKEVKPQDDKKINCQNHSIVMQNRVPKVFSHQIKYKRKVNENDVKKVSSHNPFKSMSSQKTQNANPEEELKNHRYFDGVHNISKEKGKDYEFGRESLSYIPVKRGIKYKGERFQTLPISKSIANLTGAKTKKFEKNFTAKPREINVENIGNSTSNYISYPRNSPNPVKKNTVLHNLKNQYNNTAANRTKKYKLIRKEVYEFVPDDETQDNLFVSRITVRKNRKNKNGLSDIAASLKNYPIKKKIEIDGEDLPDNFSYYDSNTGIISDEREQVITNYV